MNARWFRGVAPALLAALLTGCASTTVQRTSTPLQQSLCSDAQGTLSVALYWLPQWRADQKEPGEREALAQRGIARFADQHSCLRWGAVVRLDEDEHVPDDARLMQLAGTLQPPVQQVVLVVVRELGPRLLLGLPGLVEGGTEVVIDVRLLNMGNAQALADTRTRWRNGGAFVIRGVGSLDRDLQAALNQTLLQPSDPMAPPAAPAQR